MAPPMNSEKRQKSSTLSCWNCRENRRIRRGGPLQRPVSCRSQDVQEHSVIAVQSLSGDLMCYRGGACCTHLSLSHFWHVVQIYRFFVCYAASVGTYWT